MPRQSPGSFGRRGRRGGCGGLVRRRVAQVRPWKSSTRRGSITAACAAGSSGERWSSIARRRAATVRALTPCRLLVLDAKDFHELLDANPAMAQHVHEVVLEQSARARAEEQKR